MKRCNILIATVSCILLCACHPKVTDVSDTIKSNKLKICTTQVEGENLYGIRHVDKGMIVPVVYNKIDDDINLFICEKDGLKSIYNILGELLVEDVVEVKLEQAIPAYSRFDGGFQNEYYRLRTIDDNIYILILPLLLLQTLIVPFINMVRFKILKLGLMDFSLRRMGNGATVYSRKRKKNYY